MHTDDSDLPGLTSTHSVTIELATPLDGTALYLRVALAGFM